MTEGVLLVGASGLAREVLAAGFSQAVGVVDDRAELHGTEFAGVPVVGSLDAVAARTESLMVCVGPSGTRRRIVHRLSSLGVGDDRFTSFMADSARIGRTSVLGRGSILLDGVVVTADATIGDHVVVMPNCTITHDDSIEDFATLAAGVALGGGVRVGEGAYIGMNASARQGVRIGAGATLGMGAVALSDVPDGQTWAGVPARRVGEER